MHTEFTPIGRTKDAAIASIEKSNNRSQIFLFKIGVIKVLEKVFKI